jgi:hypothetical protein
MLGKVPQRRSAAVAVAVQAPAAEPDLPPSMPIPVDSAPPAPAQAAVVVSPAITTLEQMGLPRLQPTGKTVVDWYFQSAVHSARDVAAPGPWQGIANSSGLAAYIKDDPPGGDGRHGGTEVLAGVTTMFEAVFAGDATPKLREWGRRTTERALSLRPSSGREQRGLQLLPGRRRLSTLLKAYVESLDDMRGEPAHAWREVDADRFWVVHFQNPYAVGRKRDEKSCHFWIASYEAMLRWAGLLNDWLVEEIECGCVTGTGDCVFAIKSTRA